jgi:menaquinone-dependent protoporphyrinogen IX oxidase
MRTLIVYYSRTGLTRKVAVALAGLLGADLAEIRCDQYGPGILRYIRAAYDSVRGKLPSIELPPAVRQPYDLVIIGTPMWTGHPALPIRAFLAGGTKLPSRVALFVTRIGAPPERTFADMEARLPAAAEAKLALKSGDVRHDRFSQALKDFAAQLVR